MTNLIKIIGIDPGVTTGVAIYQNGSLRGGEITSYREIADLLESERPEIVVIEDFYIRRGKPSIYHPSIRMIGVVEYLCQELEIKFIIQSPSILTAMRWILPRGTGSPHVKAAMCHLLYHLKKRRFENECADL